MRRINMYYMSEVESGKSASEVCKAFKIAVVLHIRKAVAREPPYNMARVYRYWLSSCNSARSRYRCRGTLYPGIFYPPG